MAWGRVSAQEMQEALRAGSTDLPRLRLICVILTALSALFIAVPVTLAGLQPLPLPGLSDPAPSLDLIFSFLCLLQAVGVLASLALGLLWPRFAGRLPAPGEVWEPQALYGAIRRTWLWRFALAEGVCLLGALGFYAAHLQGLLTVAPRVWWLGFLPLLSLAWMLSHWPDAALLQKKLSRS
jgi:hypothetical protein